MSSPTTADITVNGPYSVAVVCDSAEGTRVWQASRTPDDDLDLAAPCEAAPALRMITGHMVNAGKVSLGGASAKSDQPDWDFHLMVPDGTYDLVAVDAEAATKFVSRRIVVTGDTTVASALDLAAAKPLTAVALTVDNQAKNETLVVSVNLTTGKGAASQLYVGPIETAKVPPGSALGSDDKVSISIEGQKGVGRRSLERAFPFADDDGASFTLPGSVASASWAFDSGQITVALPGLPDLDVVTVSTLGAAKTGVKTITHEASISGNYIDATALSRPILETDLPSFKPEWTIDYTKAYVRGLTTHLDDPKTHDVTISSAGEEIDPTAKP